MKRHDQLSFDHKIRSLWQNNRNLIENYWIYVVVVSFHTIVLLLLHIRETKKSTILKMSVSKFHKTENMYQIPHPHKTLTLNESQEIQFSSGFHERLFSVFRNFIKMKGKSISCLYYYIIYHRIAWNLTDPLKLQVNKKTASCFILKQIIESSSEWINCD